MLSAFPGRTVRPCCSCLLPGAEHSPPGAAQRLPHSTVTTTSEMIKRRAPRGLPHPAREKTKLVNEKSQVSHLSSSTSPGWRFFESHPVNIVTLRLFSLDLLLSGRNRRRKKRKDVGRGTFKENLGT